MKLLYAEDEKSMSEAVTDILEYHKYSVDAVYDGEEALSYALAEEYDGIILDIMMPKMDGIEVLKRLRQKGISTPVLLLTARSEIEDQVEGLDAGADDYLPKPFSMDLFLARVRALLRRREEFTPNILEFGDISLDRKSYLLSCGNSGKSVTLSNLEFRLLELLILNKNIYMSVDNILYKVWGIDSDAESNTVWVYVSFLRKHLTKLESKVSLSAKRGVGYRLEYE